MCCQSENSCRSLCLLLYFKISIYMIFFLVFAPIRTWLSFKFWWIIGRWIYKYVLCNKHKCYKTWFIAQYSKQQINFTIALVIHYLQFFCLVKSSTPSLFVLKYIIFWFEFNKLNMLYLYCTQIKQQI